MNSWRFLFSRRWFLFAIAVGLAAWAASALGQWQFNRLDERRADNLIVERNLKAPPVPVAEVLDVGEPASAQEEWRRVTIRGTWDDEHTIVLKYQTRKGASGVDVVTPLVTEDGPAVLVDRGWLATQNSGADRPETPAVTPGSVTVTGFVRQDGSGRATKVVDLSTRALSSTAVAEVLPYPLYGGFVDLDEETPEPTTALAPAELPDEESEGPHFFYGLQWWFFGALAVFGFFYLMYDERRKNQQGNGSESTQHAAVDGDHRPGDEG